MLTEHELRERIRETSSSTLIVMEDIVPRILNILYTDLKKLIILSGLLFINIITFSFFPTLLIMFDHISYPTLGPSALIAKMSIQNAYINLVSLAGVWIGGFAGFYLFRRGNWKKSPCSV